MACVLPRMPVAEIALEHLPAQCGRGRRRRRGARRAASITSSLTIGPSAAASRPSSRYCPRRRLYFRRRPTRPGQFGAVRHAPRLTLRPALIGPQSVPWGDPRCPPRRPVPRRQLHRPHTRPPPHRPATLNSATRAPSNSASRPCHLFLVWLAAISRAWFTPQIVRRI